MGPDRRVVLCDMYAAGTFFRTSTFIMESKGSDLVRPRHSRPVESASTVLHQSGATGPERPYIADGASIEDQTVVP